MNNTRVHILKAAAVLVVLPWYLSCAEGTAPLRIVGSSSVFPFAASVAEHFSYKTQYPVPLVEAIGTGAGIRLFCASPQGPDGAIASRAMTSKEAKICETNEVMYTEFIVGQDGLVLVQNKRDHPFALSLQELTQALSAKVQQGNECVKNPYQRWDQIQPSMPATPIRIFGPAPTSGTYDILLEKLENPCGAFIRHDGVYIEATTNENLIIQKVLHNAHSIGIITYSFYRQNQHRLQALRIDGVPPSASMIQSKRYPLSRPLYLYLKTHPPGQAYALEFVSPEATGEKGYLTTKGLIPLFPAEQKIMQERASASHGAEKP